MALKRLERRPTSKEATEPQDSSDRAKILYVEDEDANWLVTELHLRDKYRLKRAANSRDALSLLAHERFDLILLDIQLSGSQLDGIQICRAIRGGLRGGPNAEFARQTPIVFVTAYAARYDRQSLIEAGGDDVVTKPVDYTRLLLVSSRLLLRTLH